ncbi:MAG: LysR family transcriptional regulator [Pseudomonadota bacterium]
MAGLQHLETFVEVALRRSFAAAARQLDLPRSTVTARVKALESELGVALFQRTTRQVGLTSEGEAYLAKVQPALSVLEEVGEELKAAQDPSGLVRLTVPVDLPSERLAQALASYQERFPDVELDVHISDRPVDLIAERFDLALRGNRVSDENVIVRKIGSNPQIVVARPEVAMGESVEELAKRGRILDASGILAETFDMDFKPAGFRTTNKQLAKEIVLRRDLAAVLPRSICEAEIEGNVLCQMGAHLQLPDLPLFLVLPSARFVPRRVRLLVETFVKSLK